MPKTKKTIAKAVAVEKNIAVAVDKLAVACRDAAQALVVRTKSSKQLAAQVRKLNKKRGTLLRRKVAATKRVAREPNVANRKAARDVVKDLASTRKALAKARDMKKANTMELGALRTAAKQANGYQKAIDKVTRALSKTQKTKRR